MELFLFIYIGVINTLSFSMMGVDKRLAIKGKRRIPEKRLWSVAVIGGAIGMFIGMKKFRHKTKHTSFKVGVPILVMINLVLFYFVYTRFGVLYS